MRDNKLGFVVRRKSVAGLTDAMVRALMSDLDITAAAQRLVSRFSPQQAVRRFLEVIGEHHN